MQSQRWLKVSQRSRDSSLSGKGENYRKSPVRLSSDAVSGLRHGTCLAWDSIVRKKSKFQFPRVVYSSETWQPLLPDTVPTFQCSFLKCMMCSQFIPHGHGYGQEVADNEKLWLKFQNGKWYSHCIFFFIHKAFTQWDNWWMSHWEQFRV